MNSKIFVICVALLLSPASHAGEEDKLLSFSFSFGFGASFGMIYSPQKACAIALLPGIAKEIYNKLDKGLFSFQDVVVDGIGGCVGAYAANRFSKQYKKYKQLEEEQKPASAPTVVKEELSHRDCPDSSIIRVCNN
jgi:hypothetical protein